MEFGGKKKPTFLFEGRGKSGKPDEKWKIGGKLGTSVSECCTGMDK